MTFDVGNRVRVAEREHRGHHRTPGYLKGKRGEIARDLEHVAPKPRRRQANVPEGFQRIHGGNVFAWLGRDATAGAAGRQARPS